MRTGLPFSRKVTSCSLTAIGPYCAVGAYPTWEPRVTLVAVPERLCKGMASYLLGKRELGLGRRTRFRSAPRVVGRMSSQTYSDVNEFFRIRTGGRDNRS